MGRRASKPAAGPIDPFGDFDPDDDLNIDPGLPEHEASDTKAEKPRRDSSSRKRSCKQETEAGNVAGLSRRRDSEKPA